MWRLIVILLIVVGAILGCVLSDKGEQAIGAVAGAIVALIVLIGIGKIGEILDRISTKREADARQDASAKGCDAFKVMKESLKKLGCQPQKGEKDSLMVSYQGEHFDIQFHGLYARIWDPAWNVMRADDPDMPKARDAVTELISSSDLLSL